MCRKRTDATPQPRSRSSDAEIRLIASAETLKCVTSAPSHGRRDHAPLSSVWAPWVSRCGSSPRRSRCSSSRRTRSTRVRLDEEVREITAQIRASDYRDSVDLVSRWAVRPLDVLQALNEDKPHIVHFSGHGSSGTELVFQDDECGHSGDAGPEPTQRGLRKRASWQVRSSGASASACPGGPVQSRRRSRRPGRGSEGRACRGCGSRASSPWRR